MVPLSVILQKIESIKILSAILANPVEYLKGVGPLRADLLKKELGIFTFGDLLFHFPFRHVDRTTILPVSELTSQSDFVQLAGQIVSIEKTGQRTGSRLVAELQDQSGTIQLVWFQGLNWVQKNVQQGQTYLAFGRVSFFNGKPTMIHPELEPLQAESNAGKNYLEPVYSTTEKLRSKGLGGRQLGKLTAALTGMLREKDIPEILPASVLSGMNCISRYRALCDIHFPKTIQQYKDAAERLKFEELFLSQIHLALRKSSRHRQSRSVVFDQVGQLFHTFYKNHLPYELTGAQKRVIREIRSDTATGRQMNRLLQGDVGSGKTIVAVLVMLLAAGNGCQSCLMAPTEILAKQHFSVISDLLQPLAMSAGLLTGSVRQAERKKILSALAGGQLQILIGTHAVIEEEVQFQNLGLVVIDEQHRFGVAQRAKLWQKSALPPHVLVMTATPIPRTLAMAAYGDLEVSIIDELPPGRKPVTTVHRYESVRNRVMDFIRTELDQGRQAFIIFPLIEESDKMDYENLMKGYENIKAYFPEPRYYISMVHGRQPAEQKDRNMQRFVKNDTSIMVSTTVIEVGVDVPNASIMVIESAERFGLSQLHQLRGRVGRGADKSYCILMTGNKISEDARQRIKIMVQTNNGFEIAEKDLELRGPGEIEGTRQSGILNFKLADIVQDRYLLEKAKQWADDIVEKDPGLNSAENLLLKHQLEIRNGTVRWGKIS